MRKIDNHGTDCSFPEIIFSAAFLAIPIGVLSNTEIGLNSPDGLNIVVSIVLTAGAKTVSTKKRSIGVIFAFLAAKLKLSPAVF